MSELRVLAVLSSGELGGAELATLAALRHRPSDIDVRLVLLSRGPVEARPEVAAIPSVVISAPKSLRGRARLLRSMGREVKSSSPDLIYAVGNKAAIASVPGGRRNRVPVVWHKCDCWYDHRGAALIARQCCRVIAPTQFCGDAVGARRLVVLDPPVPIRPEYRAPLARPGATIGSIGRLEPRKGHDDVIAAAGILRPRFPDLRVIVAGAPALYAKNYQTTLVRIAAQHGVADRIEFVSHVERIEEVLSRLTLLVSASYRDRLGRGGEAFGLAVAEASWAGLPVVATRAGGTPEQVSDKVNGLLVPPRQPASLAAAIGELLTDPDRAREMGKRGAKIAHDRFDPARASRHLYSELRSCASTGRSHW